MILILVIIINAELLIEIISINELCISYLVTNGSFRVTDEWGTQRTTPLCKKYKMS